MAESVSREKLRELHAAARQAAENAYVPYSGFRVGAALPVVRRHHLRGTERALCGGFCRCAGFSGAGCLHAGCRLSGSAVRNLPAGDFGIFAAGSACGLREFLGKCCIFFGFCAVSGGFSAGIGKTLILFT